MQIGAAIAVTAIGMRPLAAGAPPLPPQRFEDDFNRPDEDLSASPDWTLANGNSGDGRLRSGGICSGTADPVGSLHLSPDTGAADHYVEASMLRDTVPFIVCRAANASDFIGFRRVSSELQVYKRVGGAFTLLYDTPAGGGTTVRLEAEGTALRIYTGSPGAWTLRATRTVADAVLQGSTRCGYVARFQVESLPVYDNFASGAL